MVTTLDDLASWRRTRDVLGTPMAWLERGVGEPVVFLHGNPTSSYLWRDVLPEVSHLGRCLAPDLVGFGHSGKLEPSGPDRYHFAEQRRHLDALLDAWELGDRVILVLHDWGSALGFDWARRHAERVVGIAYLEAVVRPPTWDDLPPGAEPLFRALRSDAGERLILEQNVYVEGGIPSQVLRTLLPEEHDAYRAPFAQPGEGRRPILSLCRDVPLDGSPSDVYEAEAAYAAWLTRADVPKLLIDVRPGSFLVGGPRAFCLAWPHQEVVQVSGLHFAQEDSGSAIGRALAEWIPRARRAAATRPGRGVGASSTER